MQNKRALFTDLIHILSALTPNTKKVLLFVPNLRNHSIRALKKYSLKNFAPSTQNPNDRIMVCIILEFFVFA
jgi:hypothetical protein